MNQKKYQKYLSKYLGVSKIDYKEAIKLFEKQYSSKDIKVNGLADLNGVTVISVSIKVAVDIKKIPDSFRGVIVRKSIEK